MSDAAPTVEEALKVLNAQAALKEAERKRRYDAATIAAGADPKTHSCPHGMSCDIHG